MAGSDTLRISRLAIVMPSCVVGQHQGGVLHRPDRRLRGARSGLGPRFDLRLRRAAMMRELGGHEEGVDERAG